MSDPVVSDSAFYMWRTLFAVAHADNVLSNEEIRYMAEVLEDVPFSAEQRDILNDDIYNAKNPSIMFSHISEVKDRVRFFKHAKELVWIDGEYAQAEQDVILQLTKAHLHNIDFDALIGSIDLELENETPKGQMTREAVSFKEKLLKKIGYRKGQSS